ncbi:hypothetical protein PLICRDRAFT_95251 [Plicaturopsis crispa FD-325 SS-3]|uniref:Homeobox domain-containing protein n=1 Tax=Plicaturopsis crispa FD-325 SS-3 TaxID=944288 RepID=A0A0C9SKS9_PLICR|nr:hypothetical protein PLICRDRAFT_95251 [Plicaturopsis crispa FD-325 SS-3]
MALSQSGSLFQTDSDGRVILPLPCPSSRAPRRNDNVHRVFLLDKQPWAPHRGGAYSSGPSERVEEHSPHPRAIKHETSPPIRPPPSTHYRRERSPTHPRHDSPRGMQAGHQATASPAFATTSTSTSASWPSTTSPHMTPPAHAFQSHDYPSSSQYPAAAPEYPGSPPPFAWRPAEYLFTNHTPRTLSQAKQRKRKTRAEAAVLKESFRLNPFPNAEERDALGERLRMSRKQVQIWFQNRRQVLKRRGQDTGG